MLCTFGSLEFQVLYHCDIRFMMAAAVTYFRWLQMSNTNATTTEDSKFESPIANII